MKCHVEFTEHFSAVNCAYKLVCHRHAYSQVPTRNFEGNMESTGCTAALTTYFYRHHTYQSFVLSIVLCCYLLSVMYSEIVPCPLCPSYSQKNRANYMLKSSDVTRVSGGDRPGLHHRGGGGDTRMKV